MLGMIMYYGLQKVRQNAWEHAILKHKFQNLSELGNPVLARSDFEL